jgi:filamentous hemagglutinin
MSNLVHQNRQLPVATAKLAQAKRVLAGALLLGLMVQGIFVGGLPPVIAAEKAYAAEGIYKPINYQGKVEDTTGVAMADGQYNMKFKIFAASSGGNALWTETWDSSSTRVTMTGGLFSLALGTHVTMTGSVDFNSDSLFLQIEFDPGNDDVYEETFSPRRRFASVPYAHNADMLDGLHASQFIRSDQDSTASGTITIKNSGVGLKVTGTASGNIVRADTELRSSGSLIVDGTTTLKNYASCSIITTDSAGNLGCGSADIQTQTEADARYVNVSGDTMTGGLVINSDGGYSSTALLEVLGVMSGRSLQITGTGAAPLIYTDITTGRVGVGTNTPSSLFNISGTLGSVAGGLSFGDGDSGIFEEEDDRIRFARGGIESWEISSEGLVGVSNAYPGMLGESSTLTNPTLTPYHSDSDTGIGADGANGLSLVTGGSARLVADSTGDIGIGTSTPGTRLDVAGGISGTALKITGAATFDSTVSLGGVTYTFPTSDGSSSGKILATDASGNLSWTTDQTGGGGGGGNVLVQEQDVTVVITGATLDFLGADFNVSESPSNEANISLDQNGLWDRLQEYFVHDAGDTMTGALIINSNGGYSSTALLEVLGVMSGRSLYVSGTGASPLLYTDTTTGRVGIGKTNLTTALDVSGDIAASTSIQIGGITNRNGFSLGLNTTTNGDGLIISRSGDFTDSSEVRAKVIQHSTEGGKLVLGNLSGTENMVLRAVGDSYFNGGDVGIGDTTPQTKLDVAGGISGTALKITGAAALDGAVTLGSTLNIGGVTYTFPTSDGTSSGKVLKTDSSGQLSWSDDTDTTNADQSLFATFAISGQSNVVADSTTDTLTLAEGSNVTITTNAGTDTITIAATDTDTTYAAGQGLALNGTVFVLNGTLTGSSLNFATISGSILHAETSLSSSGNLTVRGTMIGTGGTLKLASVGGSSYNTIQDMQNLFHSSGVATGGLIYSDGDGTITVGAGNGFIRATDDDTAELLFFAFAGDSGTNVDLTQNDMNYVYAEYNSGVPRVIATTTERADNNTNILLGTAYRYTTEVHLTSSTIAKVSDHALKMLVRMKELMPFSRVSGGLVSETGTRNFAVTSGDWWDGITNFTTSAVDTSGANTFSYYYSTGTGGWTEVTGQTQIDNTQYDDGDGTLGSLSSNKYGVHWLYLGQDGDLYALYGTVNGKLSVATDASIPASVPPHFEENHARLIGKVIIQESASSFTSIESAFSTVFEGTSATDHGDLIGLADDDHTQYVLLAGRSGGQSLIGGTGTTDDLTLQTTSGVGAAGADMIFLVGNNGGTEAMRILNNGSVGIGTSTPGTRLDVAGGISGTALKITGAATFDSTVSLGGVTYTFPTSDGTSSGKVLKTDSSGQLSWSDDTDTTNADQSLFLTLAVSGQSNVVADSTTDTLTFAEGSNVTITTNAGTDTVTIAATDTNTTYAAGQGLALNGTVFTLNGTLTGSSLNFTTISGATVHAQDLLTSSGGLIVEGTGLFHGNLTSTATISGAALSVAGSNVTIGSDGAAVFNEQGRDVDFRIEGDTSEDLFKVDAGQDMVLISNGTTATSTTQVPTLQVSSTNYPVASMLRETSVTDDIRGTLAFIHKSTGNMADGFGASIDFEAWDTGVSNYNPIATIAGVRDGADNNGAFSIQTWSGGSRSEKMRVTHDGDVGIGDTTPQTKLDVAGGISGTALKITGASSFDGAATFGSTLSLGGVTYTFPTSDGSSSGKVLKTDSSGQLSWSDDTDTTNANQSLFETFAISGQSNVVADSTTDTLTFAEGSNITITTDAGTDTITITGTDTDTTYSAGQGLALNGTVFVLNGTLTGSSLNFTTISGATVHAQSLLTSSGGLIVEGTGIIHGNLTSMGTISGANLTVMAGADSYLLGNVGIGTSSPGAKLHVSGDQARLPNGSVIAGQSPGIAFDSYSDTGFGANSDNLGFWESGVLALNLTSLLKEFRVPSDFTFAFSSATNNNSASDTSFSRYAAGVLRTGGDFIVDGDIGIGDTTPQTKLDVAGGISGTALKITGAATFDSTVSLGGVTYTFPTSDGTSSGKVLKTDSSGQLSWSDDTDTTNADQSLFLTLAVSGQSNVVADSTTDTLTFAEGSNVTITTNAGTDTVTIAATDTDTTYAAGQGLALNGTVFTLNGTLTGSSLNFTTISGGTLHAESLITSSGALIIEGAATFNSTITIGGVTYTFPSNDGSASGKILATDAAGNLSWTTDQTSAGGGGGSSVIQEGDSTVVQTGSTLDFAAADFTITESPSNEANISLDIDGLYTRLTDIFVHTSGDTMTGGLLIHSTNDATNTVQAGILLEVGGAMSGASIHAQDILSSSGQIVVQADEAFDLASIIMDQNANGTGMLIDSEATTMPLLVLDSVLDNSQKAPHILFGYQGFYDVSLYRSATNTLRTDDNFIVGTNLTVNGNTTLGNATSDTITATARFATSLVPDTDDSYDLGTSGLRWRDLYLGPASLHVGTDGNEGSIGYNTSSNYLSFDPDGDSNAEFVMLDSGKFGIGTLAPETAIEVAGTISGSFLHAADGISTSGSLTVMGAVVFKNTNITVTEIIGTLSGSHIHAQDLLTSSGGLIVEGASTLNGAVAINGVLTLDADDIAVYDAAPSFSSDNQIVTKKYVDDNDADTTYSAGQGLALNGTVFTLNGTLTGSSLNFTTISGGTLHAESLITSSGALVVEGAATFNSTITIGGVTYTFPTSDGTASGKVLATDSSGQLSWTDGGGAGTTYFAGQGLALNGTVFTLNGTLTGSLLDFSTVSGAILHARDLLRSSGGLLVGGTATLNGDVVLGSDSSDTITPNGVFAGNIVPSATNTYDLGSDSARWNELYLSGSSIHMGTSGDEGIFGFDTVGDRFTVDPDGDGDFDFRMTDIGSIDIAEVGADAPTVTGYTRLFARGASAVVGNDSGSTFLTHFESTTNLIDNLAEAKTNPGSFGGSCNSSFSTSEKKFGTKSLELNCSSYQAYRYAGSYTDDYFESSDFTVDLWANEGSHTSDVRVLAGMTAYNDYQWLIYLNASNKLEASIQRADGTFITLTSTSAWTAGNWVHVALERNGTTFRLYQDGAVAATASSESQNLETISTSRYLMFGNRYPYNFSGDSNFTGYLDEVRISKVGRYNGTFTVASSAYDDSGNGGLFVRLSDGTLTNLTQGATGNADSTWTVNDDNTIYYLFNNVGVGTATPETAFEAIGTISGTVLHAEDTLTSSGGLVIEGATTLNGAAVFGSTVSLGGVTYTFPTSDGSASGKVLKTDSSGQLSWSGDTDTTYSAGQGLALNGTVFTLNGTLTGTLLDFATISGSIVHARDLLRSSGGLLVDGNSTLNGAVNINGVLTLDADDIAVYDAAPTFSSDNQIVTKKYVDDNDSDGQSLFQTIAVSGQSNVVADSATDTLTLVGGTNVTITTNAGGDEITITSTDTDTTYGAGQGLVLTSTTFTLGTSLTGATLMSGSVLHADDLLSVSGSLVIDQNGSFYGAGLADCDNASTSKLLWDATTGQFSCGTDQNSGGGGGDPNVDYYVQAGGDTMTGGLLIHSTNDGSKTVDAGILLEIAGTMSGTTVHAQDILSSSGRLIVKSSAIAGSGAATIVAAEYQTGAYIYASGAEVLALDAYQGTQTGTNTHIAFGYRGYFDLQMYRSGQAGSGGLVIRTETVRATESVFKVISQNGTTDNNVFRVTAEGEATADGSFTGGGADYAEWFYSKDQLVHGELVCIDITRANAVERCADASDGNLMGVVSSTKQAAFIGNAFWGIEGVRPPDYHLIGLIGQVAAFVSDENGPVRPGDSLTSASKSGYAKRANAGDPTVGVALEGHESGEGRINVLISRRNSSVTVETMEEHVLETVASMEIEDEVQLLISGAIETLNVDEDIADEVKGQINKLDIESSITAAIAALNKDETGSTLPLESGKWTAALTFSEGITVEEELKASASVLIEKELMVHGAVTFSGALKVAAGIVTDTLVVSGAALILEDLEVAGAIRTESLEAEGDIVAGGTLHAAAVEASGATLRGDVSIDGKLILNGEEFDPQTMIAASGSALDIAELTIREALFVLGDVTIEGLAQFLGNVEIHGNLTVSGSLIASGTLIVNDNQAGVAVIPKTGKEVTVAFEPAYTVAPIVTASSDDFASWRIRKQSATGFTIELKTTAENDITFTWHALGNDTPKVVTGPEADELAGIVRFPVDELGYPLSSSDIWNQCIRNRAPLDITGQPFNCRRYHNEDLWTQPDLLVQFLWDSEGDPRLVVPEGYRIFTVVTEEEKEEVVEEDKSKEEKTTSTGSTKSGEEEEVTGTGSTAVGEEEEETGSGSTKSGEEEEVTGTGSTAVGEEEEETGSGSTKGGEEEEVTGTGSTAVGEEEEETGSGSTKSGGKEEETSSGSTTKEGGSLLDTIKGLLE